MDGYSLDAQKDKLRKYAEYQGMIIVSEFPGEGFSRKNIKGRPEFLRMMEKIEDGEDNVDVVLVFRLSRFGRNAADVLNSLQIMQDYGVNLICVEDGIDSSKDAGKLMISVLSGLLKCPCCGKSLYGNIAKAHSKGKYTRYYYYCKNTFGATGHKCSFRINIEQKEMNHMVAAVISAMVKDEQYDKLERIETQIEVWNSWVLSVRQEKISVDNVYQLLLAFDSLYHTFCEADQKDFMRAFIERIDIYPQKPDNNC